ncbi:MAG: hypothetical protein Q8L85_09920 [Alphaproteobacteria bacterium]|nr:hypothetical protein [Alphaproteobacteria bacterium]
MKFMNLSFLSLMFAFTLSHSTPSTAFVVEGTFGVDRIMYCPVNDPLQARMVLPSIVDQSFRIDENDLMQGHYQINLYNNDRCEGINHFYVLPSIDNYVVQINQNGLVSFDKIPDDMDVYVQSTVAQTNDKLELIGNNAFFDSSNLDAIIVIRYVVFGEAQIVEIPVYPNIVNLEPLVVAPPVVAPVIVPAIVPVQPLVVAPVIAPAIVRVEPPVDVPVEIIENEVIFEPVHPINIMKNYAENASRIEYGRVGTINDFKVILPNANKDFITDLAELAPGHYYLDFYQGEVLQTTNYLYIFPGLYPSAIQIQRYDDGFIDLYLTGNFLGKKIICGSDVAQDFEVLEGVGRDNHIMACNFLGKFYEDMTIKVITALDRNLEGIIEIPFFPDDRFAVREYNRETQEVVEPFLPIQNPIIINKNYDESDRIEYGRVGSVDNAKVILPNDRQEFIVDLDRLAPGHYYLNFYQGGDCQKTNFLYVFPGLYSSAIQLHRYPDGNMSYDLTGDFRDKKFSCVSAARAHNDIGRIYQNKLAFDRTNFIDEVLDLKIVVTMPAGEDFERIIEIPVVPNEQNVVKDNTKAVGIIALVPAPAPVILAPIPALNPIVVEQVPVRFKPIFQPIDEQRIQEMIEGFHNAKGIWGKHEDIMNKGPFCLGNYGRLQNVSEKVIKKNDVEKFNSYEEMLNYFDLKDFNYKKICENRLKERNNIIAGTFIIDRPYDLKDFTDYDYMIFVASLIRHCEKYLSEVEIEHLKTLFKGFFEDQIDRCTTGLFIRMFNMQTQILTNFFKN